MQTLAGIVPIAPYETLIVDPVLPEWLPELVLQDLRVGAASVTLRFSRDARGESQFEVVRKRGTLHIVRQPPPESLNASLWQRVQRRHGVQSMNIELKPLREQVVVITGASSGIGLVTARTAADAGASVVLAARNEHDLRDAVNDIRRRGGRATHVVADVSNPADVEALGAAASATYGRIDTWVNNAAVAVYGRIMELSLDEMRQQFDINYWGVVHGSRVAVPYLRAAGGALINIGSVLSDRAIPLQGNYSAAKHAVKGFTDALRMELEEEGAPISVTLIKPSSIDTPFFDKARSHMGVEPQPVPPVYAPELVADAILAAAVRPVRDIVVGGSGRLMSLATMAPRLTDAYMEHRLFDSQKTDKPVSGRPDNLFAPVARDGGERGRNWQGRTMRRSATTAAAMHPRAAAMTLMSAAAFALAAYVRRTRVS